MPSMASDHTVQASPAVRRRGRAGRAAVTAAVLAAPSSPRTATLASVGDHAPVWPVPVSKTLRPKGLPRSSVLWDGLVHVTIAPPARSPPAGPAPPGGRRALRGARLAGLAS